MEAPIEQTLDLGFDVISFREKIHRELQPMIISAMGRSPNAEHFRDKMDIKRLYNNLLELSENIAKEEVICRYKKKRTNRHVRLSQTAEESYETMRQMAVVFNLTH